MQDIQTDMRNRAKELLESKTVNVVIGYESDASGKPVPVFVSDPAEVDRLVWDGTCSEDYHNLVAFLNRILESVHLFPKIAYHLI